MYAKIFEQPLDSLAGVRRMDGVMDDAAKSRVEQKARYRRLLSLHRGIGHNNRRAGLLFAASSRIGGEI